MIAPTPKPETLESVGPAFSALLLRAARHDAPIFAADLARTGANPDAIDELADRWTGVSLEPASFADELRAFAESLRDVEGREDVKPNG